MVTTASRIMNATPNEQGLGVIVIGNGPSTYEQVCCVLRATSSKSRAPSSTDRAHRWLQPCGLLG